MALRRLTSASIATLALALTGAGIAAGPAQAAPGAARPAAVQPAIAAQGFTAVTPTRLLDTRSDPTIHTLGAAGTATLTVTGPTAGVPPDAEAVVLNLTAVANTKATHLTVYPADQPANSSNLNLPAGAARANQVISQISATGAIKIYNSGGSTDVIVDVTGYFVSGSSYHAQAPRRLLDTRSPSAPLAAGSTRVVQVTGNAGVPTTATSVVVNLLGLSTTHGGYLTVFPTGTARPLASNLNLTTNQAAAVLVVAKLSPGGQLSSSAAVARPTSSSTSPAGSPTPVTTPRSTRPGCSTAGPRRARATTPTTSCRSPGRAAYRPRPARSSSTSQWSPDHRRLRDDPPGWQCGPATSNVNAAPKQATANLVVAQLSPTGTVAIFDHARRRHRGRRRGLVRHQRGADRAQRRRPGRRADPGLRLPPSGPGGLAPFTWTVTGGALPDGLTMSATTGELSGTPTTAGSATARSRSWTQRREREGRGQVHRLPVHQPGVWGWGASGTDVLGASAATPSVAAPAPVSGIDGYTQLAIGGTTAYGIATDGTLWAWGKGQAGQLGDGSTTAATGTPVQVSGLAHVHQVVSGGQGATGYALLNDGTVWAWGKGSSASSATAPRPRPRRRRCRSPRHRSHRHRHRPDRDVRRGVGRHRLGLGLGRRGSARQRRQGSMRPRRCRSAA